MTKPLRRLPSTRSATSLVLVAATVMVAEDDPTVSGVLLAYLRKAGFDAFVCEDGPGALAEWSRRQPDVVILDMMLPGMSGLEVLRRRRRTTTPPR